jgi:hypothetical protein
LAEIPENQVFGLEDDQKRSFCAFSRSSESWVLCFDTEKVENIISEDTEFLADWNALRLLKKRNFADKIVEITKM